MIDSFGFIFGEGFRHYHKCLAAVDERPFGSSKPHLVGIGYERDRSYSALTKRAGATIGVKGATGRLSLSCVSTAILVWRSLSLFTIRHNKLVIIALSVCSGNSGVTESAL